MEKKLFCRRRRLLITLCSTFSTQLNIVWDVNDEYQVKLFTRTAYLQCSRGNMIDKTKKKNKISIIMPPFLL